MFGYTSVVDMLQFLQCRTLSNTVYSVSQYKLAILHFGQYLKGLLDKGLILTPSVTLKVACHVDTSSAGLHPHKDKLDSVFCKIKNLIAGQKWQISLASGESIYNT
jgi:hypothetical protein